MKWHGETLNYDVLSEMDVLYRCIKEALRLHPPLILLLRYNHKDFTVKTRQGNEYVVPKTRATTCIKKLKASSYDIGFKSSSRWIKATEVGYDMLWQNLNFEIQGERHERKRNVAFANWLPYIYKNPDTYDPDRFAPRRDEASTWIFISMPDLFFCPTKDTALVLRNLPKAIHTRCTKESLFFLNSICWLK